MVQWCRRLVVHKFPARVPSRHQQLPTTYPLLNELDLCDLIGRRVTDTRGHMGGLRLTVEPNRCDLNTIGVRCATRAAHTARRLLRNSNGV